MDATVKTTRATSREWIGLAVIALPCLLYSMDLTVLHLAVPHLSAALRPSSAQLLWIVDIYGFLLAGLLITMGTLGDRIGRRWLLLTGAAAFGGASVLAAFATSAEMLTATRAVLGVAGATTRKGKNLARDARCVVTVASHKLHLVLEGEAARVHDEARLQRVAQAYATKYDWPITVREGAFYADGAPTAGPPPYDVYQVIPSRTFAFGEDESFNPTRWRF
jgi:hypothetical protein